MATTTRSSSASSVRSAAPARSKPAASKSSSSANASKTTAQTRSAAPSRDRTTLSGEAKKPTATSAGSRNMVSGLRSNFANARTSQPQSAASPSTAQPVAGQAHPAAQPPSKEANPAQPVTAGTPATQQPAASQPAQPSAPPSVAGAPSDSAADPQKAAAAAQQQPQQARPNPDQPLPAHEAARIGGVHANLAVGSLQQFGKIAPGGTIAGATSAIGQGLAPLNLEAGRQGLNQGLNTLSDGLRTGDRAQILDGGLQTAVGAGGFTAGVAGTTQLLSTVAGVALPSATAVAATGALGGAAAVGFDGLRQTINAQDGVSRGIGITKMGAAGALATAGLVTAGVITAPAIVAAAPFLLAGGAVAAGGAYLADTETGRKVIHGGLDLAKSAGQAVGGAVSDAGSYAAGAASRAWNRIGGLLGG